MQKLVHNSLPYVTELFCSRHFDFSITRKLGLCKLHAQKLDEKGTLQQLEAPYLQLNNFSAKTPLIVFDL